MMAPMRGCIVLFCRIQSTNLPAVTYCSQLNSRTITATKTVTAKKASRIESTITSEASSRVILDATYDR